MNCKHENCKKVFFNKKNELRTMIFVCRDCGKQLSIKEYHNLKMDQCKFCKGKRYHIEFNRVIPCSCTNLNNYV